MQAGSLVAGRYELVTELEPEFAADQWTAHDRHLGRIVVVVFAESAPVAGSNGRGRLLDGGIEGDRRFLVFEHGPALDDTTRLASISADPTMVVPVAAPADDATAVVPLVPVPGAAPALRRRPRPLARAGALTLASFGMGAAAVLAYGVLTAPDPRLSGAGARTTEARDPGADARPTRTLPGVASPTTAQPTTTAVPTTAAPTTAAPTTTTAPKPTTTTPQKATTRSEPKPTTTTSRRRGRGRD